MLKFSFQPKLIHPDLEEKLLKIKKAPLPSFVTHKVDFAALEKTIKKYRRFKKLIVIGNGGSRSSGLALYQALRDQRDDKQVEFLNTPEPDYINWVKARFKPQDTLVMPISKSGTNVDALAPLTAFLNYAVLPVTGFQGSVLYEMALKRGWDVIEHPDVGGRFSGRTTCGLAPLAFLNIDIKEIDRGAKSMYPKCGPQKPLTTNPALQLAVYFYHFDRHGFDEIFASIYSTKVAGFLPLITQLVHETTGKDGKGQTIFGDVGPENQHHTVQRFFGGRKNVIGWYTLVKNLDDAKTKIKIPKDLQPVKFKDSTLGIYDNLPFARTLEIDYQSNLEEVRQRGIPHVVLTIDKVTPYTMGEFMAFLNYFAVYSALLRDQNPFDEPEVVRYKETAFEMVRKSRSGA